MVRESPAESAETVHRRRNGKIGAYGRLGAELGVDFVIMYLVMFSMIATFDHFYLNLNNVYMTIMMVAPMAIVMLITMRSMFPVPRVNRLLAVAAVLVFVAGLVAMRTQAAIGDREFLRSMIPHHSGAILMCEQASLRDPEVIALCGEIVPTQRAEIARMEAMLERY